MGASGSQESLACFMLLVLTPMNGILDVDPALSFNEGHHDLHQQTFEGARGTPTTRGEKLHTNASANRDVAGMHDESRGQHTHKWRLKRVSWREFDLEDDVDVILRVAQPFKVSQILVKWWALFEQIRVQRNLPRRNFQFIDVNDDAREHGCVFAQLNEGRECRRLVNCLRKSIEVLHHCSH